MDNKPLARPHVFLRSMKWETRNFIGVACHATDGPPTNGPTRPSTANFVAIVGLAGLSMAAMDAPAGLSTVP